ncbi:MAG TPA: hypothetical protein VG961_07855 [Ignavibacteria bacterium]|nr:hypothetical protein [Ignavibacteria bacterium]
MEIDELKNIWKENKPGRSLSESGIYESVMDVLKKAERKILFRYGLMSVFMLITFYFLGNVIMRNNTFNDLSYAGFYLLFTAMIAVFFIVWSTAIIFRRNNISNPSIDFLKSVKKKFERRKMVRKIVIPIYLGAIITGVTLVYVEVLAGLETMTRILIHLSVVLFIIVISYFVSKREKKLYEKTYKPIEERIDGLLNDYENN